MCSSWRNGDKSDHNNISILPASKLIEVNSNDSDDSKRSIRNQISGKRDPHEIVAMNSQSYGSTSTTFEDHLEDAGTYRTCSG